MIVFSGAGCELSGTDCPQPVQKRIPGSSRFPQEVQKAVTAGEAGAGAAADAGATAAAAAMVATGDSDGAASTGRAGVLTDMDWPQLVQNAEEAST
jgi:hypothetical protein